MSLRLTQKDENHHSRHPRAKLALSLSKGGGPRLYGRHWIPAPRLCGDKLRGNDRNGVIFESVASMSRAIVTEFDAQKLRKIIRAGIGIPETSLQIIPFRVIMSVFLNKIFKA
jgi:hypothetical protein